MAPTRTVPDVSFLLDRTSHVLRTRIAAALAELVGGEDPVGRTVSVTAPEGFVFV